MFLVHMCSVTHNLVHNIILCGNLNTGIIVCQNISLFIVDCIAHINFLSNKTCIKVC